MIISIKEIDKLVRKVARGDETIQDDDELTIITKYYNDHHGINRSLNETAAHLNWACEQYNVNFSEEIASIIEYYITKAVLLKESEVTPL